MADKLHVNTDWLERCERDLNAVQMAIDEALVCLNGVETSENAGGGVRVQLNGSIGGRAFQASTVAEAVAALRGAAHGMSDDVAALSMKVARTADTFSDACSQIDRTVNQLGPDEHSAPWNG